MHSFCIYCIFPVYSMCICCVFTVHFKFQSFVTYTVILSMMWSKLHYCPTSEWTEDICRKNSNNERQDVRHYLPYLHRIFTLYSLCICFILIVYSLCNCIFSICLLYICYIFMVYSLWINSVFTAFLLYIHCVFTGHSLCIVSLPEIGHSRPHL